MFDVFTDETEVIIKDGMANLYWYKGDLHKAWISSGVPSTAVDRVKRLRDSSDKLLTKRAQMDALYEELRNGDYNLRLKVSRNFVRILIEQKSFVAQDSGHQVQRAQLASFRLKEMLAKQHHEEEVKQSVRKAAVRASEDTYDMKLTKLRDRFFGAHSLAPQAKGYELEKIFTELMNISGIPVEEPFRIEGEQFDGAIKYEGRFYLVELKWTATKTDPAQIGHFHYKLSGKMDGRGLFISMEGFTDGVLATLPKGKELTMMLLDGVHLANVLSGRHTFRQLLDHAIKSVALKGEILCNHALR
ncbi:restriction endonuclease [Cupriavidus pampae]|uniref:Restriction endonuclease type IV Mrr domain-containing protein n=1 Tax=Cupriavidus pampae TaxID=659251 RepID=A0ABM8XFV8_9BURK|nr:restriction endonuclease [Cupriavidus pampae]CAG9179023.1 hypothetical protein LMG32289_04246 [Cupriavidus pampae]